MNKKMLKMFIATILTCNVMQSPIVGSGLIEKKLYNAADDRFNLRDMSVWQTAGFNTTIFAAFIGFIGVSNYVTTNYLIQEKHLVTTDFPYAQAWYDEMA